MTVSIVGAGIAGMSAGIYALQSGFEVTIYESHSAPGGASTGWRRKGYFFEGGMHWLTGSSPGTSLYKLWRSIGALDEDTPVYNRDPFCVVDYQGRQALLYRDAEKLRRHLVDLAPEDRREIDRLAADIRIFGALDIPIGDLAGLRVKEKAKVPLVTLLKMARVLPRLPFWAYRTIGDYAERFKNPLLRQMMGNIMRGESGALGMVFTLGTLAAGDGGFPRGGALAMARRMADKFEALGGVIQFDSPVDKVTVREGKAAGLRVRGAEIAADAVMVTQDTLAALDTLFDEPIREPWAEKMRRDTKPMICTFISLGLETDLSGQPGRVVFTSDIHLTCGGLEKTTLDINNYAGYEGYAPQGCTAVTSILAGDTYDFWKRRREAGTYREEKQRLAENFIEALGKKWPQIRDKIAVWDVATPLTYERYLHSYRGSFMSIMGKGPLRTYPVKAAGIRNLYFAGQRLRPPGGFPMAALSGRKAAQQLCLDTDTVFQGKS
ncbi:MAG: NAD(P)/FAD-dependent oxidoreductase [Treponema sp.]|nr:NAD(P)/FAD-dependent oxidoreductase [Treponema sp.]